MDFVKDNNPKYLKHAESMLGEFPEYVKNAYDKDKLKSLDDLSASSFANPLKREFPMDSAEHTFLSYAYCKSASITNPVILEKLTKAARIHEIDLSALDEVFMTKSASKEEVAKHFALSIDAGEANGGVRYYYPITDGLKIEKSARDLAEDYDKIPLEAFRHAALNIVKAAKANDVYDTLPDRVRYTGAHREFNYKYACQAVRQRERALGEEAASIYGDIVKSASVDVEHVNNYVDLFLDMDRINGIKYASHMIDPYEAFFSGHDIDELEKTANAYVVVYEAPIPLGEFTKLARETIKKDFAATDSELLLETVKVAEEQGGIAASEKIIQFPKQLQRQFLESLAGIKSANLPLPGINNPGVSTINNMDTSGKPQGMMVQADGANSLDMAPAPASPPGGGLLDRPPGVAGRPHTILPGTMPQLDAALNSGAPLQNEGANIVDGWGQQDPAPKEDSE